MKNKKGITIGRVLLYILFGVVFLTIIWVLVLTYREIAKNPNKTPKIECDNCLKFAAYNNDFEYSAADYISSTYLNFYNYTESIAISVYLGTINVNNTNGIYTNIESVNNSNYLTVMSPFSNADSPISPYSVISTFGNSYYISSAMKDLYTQAIDSLYLDSSDELISYNYFTDFLTNGSLYASAALVINCNIPVTMFDFTLNGISINSGESGYFYISPFSYNDGSTFICSVDSSNRFEHSSLPSAFLANYSTIKRIIIPVYQSYRSNETGFYIINNSFNYDYNSVISSSNFNVSLDFDVFTHSTAFQDGYNAGYADGVQAADSSLTDLNTELNQEVNSLNGRIRSLESQISQQSNVINNLNIELQQLQTGQFTFKNFFFSLADVPFKTVHSVLGFEFFGVNLFNFFVGILTALGIIWLIKKIL